jgi:uncharacterized protein YfcZ (UPF0381/DUF406 family)
MTTTTTILIWTLVFLALGFASLFCWAMIKLSANKKQEDKKEDEPTTTASEEDGNPDETDTDENGEGTSDEEAEEEKPCNCTEKGALAKATANSEELKKIKAEQEKTEAELKAMQEKQAKNNRALAELMNPDDVSKIEANKQRIDELRGEIRSQETIKSGAKSELPTLKEAVTDAQTAENKAATAYSIEKKKLEAAEEALKLANKKKRELPHNADDNAKAAVQAEIDAADTAVAEAEKACQAAKYAYEETFEKTDPKSGEVIERTLCAKDVTKAAIAARDAAAKKAEAAQDEIDRLNGAISRIEKENAELEAKLNGNG